jgi:hypothetical protein
MQSDKNAQKPHMNNPANENSHVKPEPSKRITVKFDVTKLEKSRFFHGKKGIYCNLTLIENPNEYGDDGYVVESLNQEQRDAGERGPIVGNWREHLRKTSDQVTAPPTTRQKQEEDGDCIPF